MPAISSTSQSRSLQANAQKIKDSLDAISLMKYFDPFMDWLFGIALCFALFKDISDFIGLGSLPVIGTLITFGVSFIIGMIMFLTGSTGKVANAKRIVKSLVKKWGVLFAGTAVEMFFGLNFFPIETAMVVVVFYLTLQERMLADKETQTEAAEKDSSAIVQENRDYLQEREQETDSKETNTGLFGKTQATRKFTKEYSQYQRDELAKKMMAERKTGAGNLGKIDAFYQKQLGIKESFEKEKESGERSVAEILRKEEGLFLHALPSYLDPKHINNTSDNNPIINTTALGGVEKGVLAASLEPTISTSFINKENQNRIATMYPIGLIVSGGNILSAYKDDAGSIAEGTTRRPKYDRTLNSTIQENPGENFQIAKNRNKSNYPWNEIVIEKPKFSGCFVDMERTSGMGKINGVYEGTFQALKISEKLGMPLYSVDFKTGKIFDLLSDDWKEISRKDVLAYQLNLKSVDKKKNIEDIILTRGNGLKPEIKKRLSELETENNNAKDLLANEENHREYAQKAKEILYALENQTLAKYVLSAIQKSEKSGAAPDYSKLFSGTNVSDKSLELIKSFLKDAAAFGGEKEKAMAIQKRAAPFLSKVEELEKILDEEWRNRK